MSDETRGGVINEDAMYGEVIDGPEKIHAGVIHYNIDVSVAELLLREVRELIEVHAFELTGDGGFNYLFIWINDYGLKFMGVSLKTYEEAKEHLINYDREKITGPSGRCEQIPGLVSAIARKIERFSL
ncbi:TPA: hypothetical protein OUK36_003650 [Klebsiella oxytoca]|nr:hypothetical protein [Klebsiella oxytoca]